MVELSIAYDGGINPVFDEGIRARARAYGATELGSGAIMAPPFTRDLAFRFPSARHVIRFRKLLPAGVRTVRTWQNGK